MTQFKRKRKQKSKADAIFCADLHIRPDIPICRTDDFFSAMNKKTDFIIDLSREHNCPVLMAGDISKRPLNNGWPTWLLEWFINKLSPVVNRPGLNTNWICIPGQHDLPGHRLDLFEKSGMGVLTAAGVIQTIFEPIVINDTFGLFPFPYGQEIKSHKSTGNPNIAMAHMMVLENKKLWPDQKAPKANALLKKFPCYDLILTGDNHSAFVIEHEGRLLVNPGSMMRTSVDQIDHKPRIYLWFSESNTVEAVYLPIEQNVIDKTHIEVAKDREIRNEAFVSRINNDVEIELSYEKNLENYFKKYRTEKPITQKVWGAVE